MGAERHNPLYKDIKISRIEKRIFDKKMLFYSNFATKTAKTDTNLLVI
jgi:hypothetical protein